MDDQLPLYSRGIFRMKLVHAAGCQSPLPSRQGVPSCISVAPSPRVTDCRYGRHSRPLGVVAAELVATYVPLAPVSGFFQDTAVLVRAFAICCIAALAASQSF